MTSEKFLKSQAAVRVLHAKAEWYKRYPMTWLLGDEYAPAQAFTQDEHDPSISAKPFPNKGYIRQMVELWLETKMNLWEECRQIMARWTFCALYLHDRQFISAIGGRRLNLIRSKKEEDSCAACPRCSFF